MLNSLKSLCVILILSHNAWGACSSSAIELVYQFSELHKSGVELYRQKALLERALELCPTMPEAHNNLASLLEDEGAYSKAISHYKQALQYRADLHPAWYGLGETYLKQGRFVLSLEAHLQACQFDKDSKKRVTALLRDKSYAVTEAGKIIDKDSLLALYDPQRRQVMNRLLSDDTQPFKGVPKLDRYLLNVQLSRNRAATIAAALAERGVTNLETYGHGYRKPLVQGNNPAAWAKNRRVEIQVR